MIRLGNHRPTVFVYSRCFRAAGVMERARVCFSGVLILAGFESLLEIKQPGLCMC